MNRRRFITLAIATQVALRQGTQRTVAQSIRPAFLDTLDVDLTLAEELYIRTFQMPSTSSPADQLASLYWVGAVGAVIRSEADVDQVLNTAYRSFPEWYVAGSDTMTLGDPFAASLGGQKISDGAAAWYWDVVNPDDEDDVWKSFGIGCVSIWSDRRLLLLWGCAALENPVGQLFELAATVHTSWDINAASLVPTIDHIPIGMVMVDEGILHSDSRGPRPGH